jgi:hypothetical protein
MKVKTVGYGLLSKFTDIPYNNGTKNKVPNTRPIGIYFIVFFDRLFNLDSSIIIAKQNGNCSDINYNERNAKSSHSSKNSINAEYKTTY